MRPRSIRTAVAGTLIAGLALGMGGCATDGGGEVTLHETCTSGCRYRGPSA